MLTTESPSTWYLMPEDAAAARPALIALLDAALVRIAVMAYGFSDVGLIDALCRAHLRAVDVQIILDHTEACGPTEVGMLHRLLLTVPAANVRIGTSPVKGAIHHSKVCIVDHRIVAEGSTNWTESAWQQANTLTVSDDVAIAAALEVQFASHFAFIDTHEPQYNGLPG